MSKKKCFSIPVMILTGSLFSILLGGCSDVLQIPVAEENGSSFATTKWTLVDANGSSGEHVVALKSDGTLWAWGRNDIGQLGDGTTTDKSSPIQIGTGSDWTTVVAGGRHTLALKNDGTLWAWGVNAWGNLGDGTIIAKSSPIQVGADSDWSGIAAGGSSYSIALKSDGTLWAWGINNESQLGTSTSETCINEPYTLSCSTTPIQVGTDTNWLAIAASGHHTVALKKDGTIWAWGINSYGQLGDGTSGNISNKTSPIQVGTDTNWLAIAVGGNHTVALKKDGTMWAWGRNNYGQLGDGTSGNIKTSPIQIGTETNWSDIATGEYHTVALKKDETMWAWGRNNFGQLGDSSTNDRSSPVQVGIETDWKAITAAETHTIAIKNDGTMWSWGIKLHSGLEGSSIIGEDSPIQVHIDTDWSAISAGSAHNIALKSDGSLWAWGSNGSGQLGDGSTSNRASPVRVGTDTDWTAIEAGAHNIALKSDGSLWAWGG